MRAKRDLLRNILINWGYFNPICLNKYLIQFVSRLKLSHLTVNDLHLTVNDLHLTVNDLHLTVNDLHLTVNDLHLTVNDLRRSVFGSCSTTCMYFLNEVLKLNQLRIQV